MSSVTDPKPKTRRSPQARGVARREKLLVAAVRLLEEKELDEISLADVAAQAGIPVASAYTFYPNINFLFAQLMNNFSHQMADEIEQEINVAATRSWLDVIDDMCDRLLAFFQKHQAYEQIRLSGKAPGEIRYNEDRERGIDFAPRLRAMIDSAYVLPALAEADRPFLIMLDLVDGIFTSEFIREKHLSLGIAQEAKRAAAAYLKLYIPEHLPPRGEVDQPLESKETPDE